MASPLFKLRILGPTELVGLAPEIGDAIARQPKRLALLAYLVLTTAEGFRRRDQITALFWPELDQAQARTYLRKALYAIRDELGEDLFVTRGEDEIRIDNARVTCDALELTRHARAGEWRPAVSLYRGELLDGLFPEGVAQEFQEWLDAQRKATRMAASRAAAECSRIAEEEGDLDDASMMARRSLEIDPDSEEGVRRLMSLMDRRGDRASALRMYSEWQARLRDEYGVEPAPETRKVARQIQAARKGESHETPPTLPAVTVPPVEPATPAAAVSPSGAPIRWVIPAIIGTALILLALARAGDEKASSRSMAVLPLRTIGDAQLKVAADALTEELTTSLAQDSTFTVRSASRAADGAEGLDLDRLRRQLGVAYVADGAVQRSGSNLRITLRLLRTKDAVAVWAGSYDVQDGTLGLNARQVAHDATAGIRGRLSQTTSAARGSVIP